VLINCLVLVKRLFLMCVAPANGCFWCVLHLQYFLWWCKEYSVFLVVSNVLWSYVCTFCIGSLLWLENGVCIYQESDDRFPLLLCIARKGLFFRISAICSFLLPAVKTKICSGTKGLMFFCLWCPVLVKRLFLMCVALVAFLMMVLWSKDFF
jgi:hypothetical protein